MRKKQKKLYICISVNYILQFKHIENAKIKSSMVAAYTGGLIK